MTLHSGADDLLMLSADGDVRAFTELYRSVFDRVFQTVRTVVIDPAQSEEVAQEVLLEVWSTAGRYDRERAGATTWISTIARRRAVDRVRASQASVTRDVKIGIREWEFSPYAVDEVAHTRLDYARALAALAEVPDAQRQAITLHFCEGRSFAETAALLGVAPSTAKGRIAAGLARLRELLGT